MPKLKLAIRKGLTEDLIARVDRHQLDAVLLALPVSETGLRAVLLFEEPFWLVCPPGHPLTRTRRVRQSDLAGQSILLLSEGHCFRKQALDLCRQESASPGLHREEYRATSLETLRHLVEAGFGCTLLPSLSLRSERQRPLPLKAIPVDSPGARRSIGLVWRVSHPGSDGLEKLAQFVARQSAGWLQTEAEMRRSQSRG